MVTSTKPPGGTRDFLPDDVRRREHVVRIVREVYERYGFEPLETPAFENIETLLGKYGEEGNKLIFKILRRGEHESSGEADLALRYDLTVPLARVVAQYQNELPKFFKRYQIQPVWRADRPARGRFREFYQCDVDIVGSKDLVCEVEVASAVCEVLDRLGFDDYRVRLNHRALLRGMIEASGVPLEREVDAITELDKLGKVSPDEVRAALEQRGIPAQAAARLLEIALGAGAARSGRDLLEALGAALATSEAGRRGVAELRQLLGLAEHAPCGKRLQLDPSLARGLSYYTGPVFEVQVPDLGGSLGGGGRYDDLIGMFLKQPLPAVGFSLGLERILVVMAERRMFPDLATAAPVMVLRLEDGTTAETLRVAAALRAAGIPAELYPNVDKLGKQLGYAESRGAKLVAFVGTREQEAGQVALKVMATQQQLLVPRESLVSTARDLLRA